MGLRIQTLPVGMLDTNCYIVSDEETREAVVVDPGGDSEAILGAIRGESLAVRLIVDTHGHFDHVLANGAIRQATGAPIAVNRADAAMLTEPVTFFAGVMGGPPSPPPDRFLADGEEIALGGRTLRVLATPGHSPGCISLYAPDAGAVLTGDALFRLGVGRTDLPGGDPQTLEHSIRTRLYTLPDETIVYPGHGPATTIGEEKRGNPFVREA